MTLAPENEARCTGLVIATPAHGGFVLVPYQQSLAATQGYLWSKWKLPVHTIVQSSDSCITRARSVMVHKFLRDTTASHLMFADADLEWDAPAVERLICSNFDVCCGAYPFKSFPPDFVFHHEAKEGEPIHVDPRTGYWRIGNAATGFLMMKRSALERMIAAYPETKVRMRDGQETIEDLHFLFDNSIEDGQYWTEDYTFTRRWRAIGGEVWLDPQIHLKHWGMHAFDAGVPADHVKPAPQVLMAAE